MRIAHIMIKPSFVSRNLDIVRCTVLVESNSHTTESIDPR